MRVDVVEGTEEVATQASVLLAGVTRNGISRVMVGVFSAQPARADPMAETVMARLRAAGVEIEDAFRADGGRWWSYTCHDPRCCSPDGVPYDAGTSRVAAEAVVSGMSFEADREALRSRVAPADDTVRSAVAREVADLRSRLAGRLWTLVPELPGRLAALVDRGRTVDVADAAWLALAVQSSAGQDAAMRSCDRDSAAEHFAVWSDVLQRAPDDLVPAVGALAAFCAWLAGRGVLAAHALDRVFAVERDHALAGMLGRLLAAAVDPRAWEESRSDAHHDGDNRHPPPAA
jgi:hypothetical protein